MENHHLFAFAIFAASAAAAAESCPPPAISIDFLPADGRIVTAALPDKPIEPFRETTFGLTTVHPVFTVKITPVHAESLCIDQVEATLGVSFPDGIEIALNPRLAEGSCALDKILAHERIHAEAAIKGAAAALDAGRDALSAIVAGTSAPAGGQAALWSPSLPSISAAMKMAYAAASDPLNAAIDTQASIKATIAACNDWPRN